MSPARHVPSTRRARGFGLVETMVAVAVGLFLSLVVAVAFGSTRVTFLSQGQLAQLQDQERLVLSMLTTTTENAGYYPDPVNRTAAEALPADNTYGPLAAGRGIWSESNPAGFERLLTRYVSAGGDGLMDCLGGTYAVATTIVNEFTVNARGELQCSVNGNAAVALASGVSGFDVRYGVDTDGDGNPDRYLDAAAMTPPWWTSARVVLVTVAFLNPLAGQPGQPPTVSWTQTVRLMNET